ncbi:MAG: hydrogenase formation protein HypD [Candidatus Hodarchaeota archaeon]
MFRFRDKKLAERITDLLKDMNLNIRLMHVCGTHQDTLLRFGLDETLSDCGVEVRQGPGCPVCVTTTREIEEGITLARKGKIVATYGDMVGVPGNKGSLADVRGEGFIIKIVYSIEDAVALAKETKKDVIFMAVGFETTAPSTAITLLAKPPDNFSIICCHRYIPPALDAILRMGEIRLDGFIEPGHVSTIIGVRPYEEITQKYGIPQVIAGFEPLDLLMAVYMLARQVESGKASVENEYMRSVEYDGNIRALHAMSEVFAPIDTEWRGFPKIPNSGMSLKSNFAEYDARLIYEDELEELQHIQFEEPEGCLCSEILRGIAEPSECSLFGKVCKPQNPIGPCMVSVEGSCNIMFKYDKRT